MSDMYRLVGTYTYSCRKALYFLSFTLLLVDWYLDVEIRSDRRFWFWFWFSDVAAAVAAAVAPDTTTPTRSRSYMDGLSGISEWT